MTAKQPPELVLFGDSLTEWSFSEATEGFGLYFETRYRGKARIVNEGQAGYTSTRLKSDFDRIIARATSPNAAPTLLFTIFLGANDACFIGSNPYVPWPTFSENIRSFVDTILANMAGTKIVLITPPPINGPEALVDKSMTEEEIEEANDWKKEEPRFKTYMNKKKYAEGIVQIAKEYEGTGRVVGLDYWNALVDAKVWEDGDEGVAEEFVRVPGCGLIGAKNFKDGWFTDGLHLDKKGYNVLSTELMKLVTENWPELAPENL